MKGNQVFWAVLRVTFTYISFVRPRKEFERNGNDVISRVNISFAQVALGATIQVNTLDGKVELKDPRRYSNGNSIPRKGQGIPCCVTLSNEGINILW